MRSSGHGRGAAAAEVATGGHHDGAAATGGHGLGAASAVVGHSTGSAAGGAAATVFSVDLSRIAHSIGLSADELCALQERGGAAVGRFQAAVLEHPESAEDSTAPGVASVADPQSQDTGEDETGWRLKTPTVSSAVISTTARPVSKEERTMARELVQVDGSGGRTVLELLLECLCNAGVRRVLLILGRFGQEIERVVQRRRGVSADFEVECVHLGANYTGGFARSLIKARRFVGQDLFLLVYSNHVFDPRLVHMLADTLPSTMKTMGGENEAVAMLDTTLQSAGLTDEERDAVPKTVGRVSFDSRTRKIREISRGLRDFNAIDTGLFLVSPSVLELILDAAISEERFTLMDIFRVLTNNQTLSGVSTEGLRWMTVEPRRRAEGFQGSDAIPRPTAAIAATAAGLARPHGRSRDPWHILARAATLTERALATSWQGGATSDENDDHVRSVFVMGMEPNSVQGSTAVAEGNATAARTAVAGDMSSSQSTGATAATLPAESPPAGSITTSQRQTAAAVTAAGHGGILVPVRWRAPKAVSQRHSQARRSRRTKKRHQHGRRFHTTASVQTGIAAASSSSSGADSEDNATRRRSRPRSDPIARSRTVSGRGGREAPWRPALQAPANSAPLASMESQELPGMESIAPPTVVSIATGSSLAAATNEPAAAAGTIAAAAGEEGALFEHREELEQKDATDGSPANVSATMEPLSSTPSAITMPLGAGDSVPLSEKEALLVMVPRQAQPRPTQTESGGVLPPPTQLSSASDGAAGEHLLSRRLSSGLQRLEEGVPLTSAAAVAGVYGAADNNDPVVDRTDDRPGPVNGHGSESGFASRVPEGSTMQLADDGRRHSTQDERTDHVLSAKSFVERAARALTGQPADEELPTREYSYSAVGTSEEDKSGDEPDSREGSSGTPQTGDDDFEDWPLTDRFQSYMESPGHQDRYATLHAQTSESEGGGRRAVSDYEHGRLTHPLRRKLVAKSSRDVCAQVARETQLLMALPARRASFSHVTDTSMRGRLRSHLPSLPHLPTDVEDVRLEATLEAAAPDEPAELEPHMRVIVTRRVPLVGWFIMLAAVVAVSSIGPFLSLQAEVPAALQSAWRQSTAFLLFSFLAVYERVSSPQPEAEAETATDAATANDGDAARTDGDTDGGTGTALVDVCKLAGVVLLCGFGSFIFADTYSTALQMTSIAHATLFSNMTPVFVVLSRLALTGVAGGRRRELGVHGKDETPVFQPVSYLEIMGAGVAIAGGAVTTLDRSRSSGSSLMGDLVALLGSAGGAIYLTGSKFCRSRLDLWLFLSFLELIMASLSVCVCVMTIPEFELLSRGPYGFFGWTDTTSWRGLPLQLLITLVADLGGIGGYVASLRYVGALVISMCGLLEPFIAIGETQLFGLGPLPGTWTWVGGVITVIGVALVILQSSLPRKQVYDASDAIGQGTSTISTASPSHSGDPADPSSASTLPSKLGSVQ